MLTLPVENHGNHCFNPLMSGAVIDSQAGVIDMSLAGQRFNPLMSGAVIDSSIATNRKTSSKTMFQSPDERGSH